MEIDLLKFNLFDRNFGNSDTVLQLTSLYNQGITTIIFTPIYRNDQYSEPVYRIRHKIELLNSKIHQENLNVRLVEGMEILLYKGLIEDLEKGELMTLAGTNKYLLIALPKVLPDYTKELFYELQIRGFVPIVAHPETNPFVRKRPHILMELVHLGALIQVNADSLLGKSGRAVEKFAKRLFKHDMVHFIHTNNLYESTKQPLPLLIAHRVISSEHSRNLSVNARHILYGTDFNIIDPLRIKK